jgi:hypothetical protein
VIRLKRFSPVHEVEGLILSFYSHLLHRIGFFLNTVIVLIVRCLKVLAAVLYP